MTTPTVWHPRTQDCPDQECMECGKRDCPYGEPLHYHHDGCPACESAYELFFVRSHSILWWLGAIWGIFTTILALVREIVIALWNGEW